MIVIGDDLDKCNFVNEFEMNDLGPLNYFLGFKVSRSKLGIFIFQLKCTLDLLKEIRMEVCNPTNLQLKEGMKLCIEENQSPTNIGDISDL